MVRALSSFALLCVADAQCTSIGVVAELMGDDVKATTYTGSTDEEKDASCCAQCESEPQCEFWVRATDSNGCWLKKGFAGFNPSRTRRGNLKNSPTTSTSTTTTGTTTTTSTGTTTTTTTTPGTTTSTTTVVAGLPSDFVVKAGVDPKGPCNDDTMSGVYLHTDCEQYYDGATEDGMETCYLRAQDACGHQAVLWKQSLDGKWYITNSNFEGGKWKADWFVYASTEKGDSPSGLSWKAIEGQEPLPNLVVAIATNLEVKAGADTVADCQGNTMSGTYQLQHCEEYYKGAVEDDMEVCYLRTQDACGHLAVLWKNSGDGKWHMTNSNFDGGKWKADWFVYSSTEAGDSPLGLSWKLAKGKEPLPNISAALPPQLLVKAGVDDKLTDACKDKTVSGIYQQKDCEEYYKGATEDDFSICYLREADACGHRALLWQSSKGKWAMTNSDFEGAQWKGDWELYATVEASDVPSGASWSMVHGKAPLPKFWEVLPSPTPPPTPTPTPTGCTFVPGTGMSDYIDGKRITVSSQEACCDLCAEAEDCTIAAFQHDKCKFASSTAAQVYVSDAVLVKPQTAIVPPREEIWL